MIHRFQRFIEEEDWDETIKRQDEHIKKFIWVFLGAVVLYFAYCFLKI